MSDERLVWSRERVSRTRRGVRGQGDLDGAQWSPCMEETGLSIWGGRGGWNLQSRALETHTTQRAAKAFHWASSWALCRGYRRPVKKLLERSRQTIPQFTGSREWLMFIPARVGKPHTLWSIEHHPQKHHASGVGKNTPSTALVPLGKAAKASFKRNKLFPSNLSASQEKTLRNF